MPVNSPDELHIEFSGRSELENAYHEFYRNSGFSILKIKATGNYTEVCNAFNSMFKRIEAAGGIVRNPQKEFLFIKRLGVWDLPKGKLHKNEPKENGGIREVTEETGLTDLRITKALPSTFHIYTDRQGREILKETYWFEMIYSKDEIPVPQTEEDITEVRWFSQSDLHIPLQNTYASLKQLLENYFSALS